MEQKNKKHNQKNKNNDSQQIDTNNDNFQQQPYQEQQFDYEYYNQFKNQKGSKKNQKQNKSETEKVPASIYEKDKKFYLVISAKPNAKNSELMAITDECLEIRIGCQPVDGQANEELQNYLCQILDIKKRNINLDKGKTSRSKIIELIDTQYSNTLEIYQQIKDLV
ncbi:Protein of unknown function DUF167 [Pseudocohnilembus persalinus]|uniref:YggU-like protein n=1 Tax=Pseudocohnilembus persalinus TaxID=266149 RepID=A0A0V0QLL3_PSEPJ|nr:Protein of unknown function DUF167 [Pseudocohnilembus persalinus]|eukprot:KRX03020.1 Protein of unknown function DUF167 [Pseudocohnilembus persalinus]